MKLIAINAQANSGATTCANIIGLPIISLVSEVDSLYKSLYKHQDIGIDVIMIPEKSDEEFSHIMFTQEDLDVLYKNTLIRTTVRCIKLSIENIIRNKDPLYFVKQCEETIKNTKDLVILNIRTTEEAIYLKQIRSCIIILQIIRATEDEGIYNGHNIDNKLINKKILNMSDLGTLRIKMKTILNDM